MLTTGTKYQSGMDTAEAAKRIRADIKAAQKAGTLPASLKVAVRISRYSMGSSISVVIQAAALQIWASEFVAFDVAHKGRVFFQGERFTKQARSLLAKVEAIAGEYQRCDRDSQSDYNNSNFHLNVDFASNLRNEDLTMQQEYHRALAA
jgi:hypothetical protein